MFFGGALAFSFPDAMVQQIAFIMREEPLIFLFRMSLLSGPRPLTEIYTGERRLRIQTRTSASFRSR
jgi:hypothetical protein